MDIATAKREAAAARKEETAAAKAESEAAERERAAGAEKKEAIARKLAARKKAVAAEAIINNTSSTVAAAPAPSMPPRNRRGDEELVQLPDMNKNSLDAMRQKRKAVNGRFSVGGAREEGSGKVMATIASRVRVWSASSTMEATPTSEQADMVDTHLVAM